MDIDHTIHSDLPVPPGEYLQEVLDELGISQKELAERTGRPHQAINEIVNGRKAITAKTALQLETVLGVPAHIWTGLESDYQLARAGQEQAETLEADKRVINDIPFKDMADLGWVDYTRKPAERIQRLRAFFGVASLQNIPNVGQFAPAFRHAATRQPSGLAVAAWLRGGEKEAADADVAAFNRKKLLRRLGTIRTLTLLDDPNTVVERLTALLAECGVAFVLKPHFPKTYLTGATFWMRADNRAVLMMSLRGSWADIFWFTLFHELGHIIKHDKRHTFVDFEGPRPAEVATQEAEADRFASDALIAPDKWQTFVEANDFSTIGIHRFAESCGIAPGIVTGRLQHEQRLPPNFHHGRARWKWQKP